MRFALPALTVLVLAQPPARDAFIDQRAAAAALNPASSQFTIALPVGQVSFRVGERIPIVFAYDNLRTHSLSDQRRPYIHFAHPVIDRIDGTARPDADFARARLFMSGGVCCGSPGGVVGGAFIVSPPTFAGLGADGSPIIVYPPQLQLEPPPMHYLPVERTYVLNDGVRFDTPGRYRFYIEDTHDRERERESRPLVSNVVEIEITPRDDAADERAVTAAITVLQMSTEPAERVEAARTLGYVGSPLAIEQMARRLYSDGQQHDENYYLAAGLFAVRDRALAIASMEAQIDDPRREVTAYYCQTLAALQLVTRTTERLTSADKINAVRAVEIRRLRALARAGDTAAAWSLKRSLKRMAASPRRPTQHEALPVMDDSQAQEAGRIHAFQNSAGAWLYMVGDRSPVSLQRLDSELRRYPRGTVFRWTDSLEYTLQSWYIDTDAEIARVAAVLARHGMRLTR